MLHAPGRTRLSAVGSIAIAVALAACTSGTQAAGGGSGGDTAGAQTIRIASPAEGATVTVPFDVTLESSVPLGKPDTGNHHAHLYFDTGTDGADYDILYSDTWQVTRPLAPGKHTLTVALANPDHSLAGPTQSITIEVGPATGGGTPSAAPSSPPTPSY